MTIESPSALHQVLPLLGFRHNVREPMQPRLMPGQEQAADLSAHQIVNINGVGTFLWPKDQVLRLCFDPMFPKDR